MVTGRCITELNKEIPSPSCDPFDDQCHDLIDQG